MTTRPASAAIARIDRLTADASQPAKILRTWVDVEYHQMSAGRFSGHLSEIRFGKTRLIEERQNCTVLKQGILPADRCNLSFSRDVSNIRTNAHRIDRHSVVFIPGGLEFDVLLPPSEVSFLSFDRAELMAAADASGSRLNIDAGQWVMDMPGGNGLAHLADMLFERDAHVLASLDPDYLGRLVIDQALDLLVCHDDPRPGESNAYRIASSAREFVDANPLHPLTVLELCQALKVSRRTLQNSFMQIYGIPPLTYLRVVRLNRARCNLISARDSETTVTDIATHWGFWHLARFAQQYRQQFGELPSDTLRRSTGNALPISDSRPSIASLGCSLRSKTGAGGAASYPPMFT